MCSRCSAACVAPQRRRFRSSSNRGGANSAITPLRPSASPTNCHRVPRLVPESNPAMLTRQMMSLARPHRHYSRHDSCPLVKVMTESISSAIFREYDIRGVAGRDLTPTVAHAIGCAFSVLLADRCKTGAIAVGRDNRTSGPELHDALLQGLTESGVNVCDVGEV